MLLIEKNLENLYIAKGHATPSIEFDREAEKFEIKGLSVPENCNEFYRPTLLWMSEYIKNPLPVTRLIIDIEYMNTTSCKMIIDLIRLLEAINHEKNEVEIIWQYKKDDEDNIELGNELSEFFNITFTHETY